MTTVHAEPLLAATGEKERLLIYLIPPPLASYVEHMEHVRGDLFFLKDSSLFFIVPFLLFLVFHKNDCIGKGMYGCMYRCS